MIESTVLLYLKDFTATEADRFFFAGGDSIEETDAASVASFQGRLITHDYCLIAPSLYRKTGTLPREVIDLGEFRRATCALAGDKDGTFLERIDHSSQHEVPRFSDVFYRKESFSLEVYKAAGAFLLSSWDSLQAEAERNDELARYFEIEIPVSNLVWLSSAKGVRVDCDKLRTYKQESTDDYYLTLKSFCVDFNLPLEMPAEDTIEREVAKRNFDVSGGNIDYIIQFIPMKDEFGTRLHQLQKIYRSLSVLNQLPVSRKIAHPLVDLSGTATSRIILRAPALQNLAKRHRDVIVASPGMKLAYVDYCQYEPGIICALSDDAEMLALYNTGDLYTEVSRAIFGNSSSRKIAKQLFLSFSYGMSPKRLADAAAENGALRANATAFFKRFVTFEHWRNKVAENFERDGKIGTSQGNFLRRKNEGELSPKERRSCVSQVVQGTASLIFKKTLIRLSSELGIEPLVPMHDAVLFEYSKSGQIEEAIGVFESVFRDHFQGKVSARAAAAEFAAP